jgi:ATP/maltotriose-dependent transcriptional regulator MalT
VFRGCTLAAAEEVCAGAAPRPGSLSVALAPLGIDVFDGVTSLVEKSLLKPEETEDGQPWYVMLETVREFAAEQLAATGEEPAARRRHALYCLRLAEGLDVAQGPNVAQRLDRLEREHDNCREALRWCEAQGYGEPALRLAVALSWFWSVRGHASEGRGRFAAVLARFKAAGVNRARAPLYAQALVAAGRLASLQGDLAGGRFLQEQALHTLEEHGDTEGMYATLLGLGVFAGQAGDYAVSRRFLERAVNVARESGDLMDVVMALANLAMVAADEGDYDRARVVAEECQALGEQAGDLVSARPAIWALAWVALGTGEHELASSHMARVLRVSEAIGDTMAIALTRANLGVVLAAKGDFAGAREHLIESLQLNQSIKDLGGIAFSLDGLATAAVLGGHADRALRLAGAAAALRRESGIALPSRAQGRLDAKLAPARAALGDLAAGKAFAAGHALRLEEAIEEALAPEPVPLPNAPSGSGDGDRASLSPRESDVAVLVARGLTNRQIADELVISVGTCDRHVSNILDKLGLATRAQIGAWAAEQGLLKAEK